MKFPTWTIAVCSLFGTALAALPAQGYEEISVSDGGTITGKVVYEGAVPTRKIVVTKDMDVCGGIREEPEIIVGPDKGAQDVVVQLIDVARGKAWPDMAVEKPVLDNVKCVFEPHVQVIRAGAVDIVNSDPILHNTHGYYGKRTAFNVALPNKDQRIEVELTRPGQVRVDCDAHGWMEGWIYVVENPYYAITAADGSFSISDVPAGEYKLVANHALTGPMETTANVESGGSTEVSIELKR
ncbi:MAG: hypothetical protein ACFCUQ_15810 [Kiloniellales bacterium]